METRASKRRKLNETSKRYMETVKNPVHDKLHDQGYVIVKNKFKIPDNVKNHFEQTVQRRGSAIFNHNENSKHNDRKRIQVNVTAKSKYIQGFMDTLNQSLAKSFRHLEINDWVVIGSKPGCKNQAAHTDYSPSPDMTDESKIPINVLIALEDGTLINVWPGSHGLICNDLIDQDGLSDWDKMGTGYNQYRPIKMQTLSLNKGDLLLFRGDLVHAGASYEKANCRLHCYLDAGYREPNRTWLINRHASQYLRDLILT